MRRRHLLAATATSWLGCGAVAANAQRPLPRIGFLIAGEPEPVLGLFRKAMADIGHVDGRTIRFEVRVADAGRGLAALAKELVELNVDLIVAVLTPAIIAAKAATTKIPIVFNGGAAEAGIVTNFARPEGNLTGIWGATSILAGKSVQIFSEIKPTTRSLGLLLNAPDPFHVPLSKEVETAGKAQKIEIVPMMLKGRDELPAAVDELARRGADGLLVQPSLPLETAAQLALAKRLPAISFRREFAVAGGFLSLGADQVVLTRMLAGYVDKVLKGVKTSDLPVQQADKFELVVNQRTAKALGLALAPMFLTRADEVIE